MNNVLEALTRARALRAAMGLVAQPHAAYRLLHGVADGVPDLTVDVYGGHCVASVYAESVGPREEAAFDALLQLGYHSVYLKHRPRKANAIDDAERLARAPSAPVRGEAAADPLRIEEHGVPYRVRLGDGFSTGIFLDQRDNRARVMAEAAGLRVLNLFAYTCAFGLVAASAGASTTTNVDIAKPALARGRENYDGAGLSLEGHRFLARDVLETVPRMARNGEQYDLVVLDPPSYASSKTGRFTVERDYPELVARAVSVLSAGGRLLACTNHQSLDQATFDAALRQGLLRAGREAVEIVFPPPPADHPVHVSGVAHLKSAWVRVK